MLGGTVVGGGPMGVPDVRVALPAQLYGAGTHVIAVPRTDAFRRCEVTFTREGWPPYTAPIDPVTGHLQHDLVTVAVEVSTDDGQAWSRIRRVTFPGGDIALPPSQGGGASPTCGFTFDRLDPQTGRVVARPGRVRLVMQTMDALRTAITVDVEEVPS